MQLMQHIIKNTIFSTKTQQDIPFRQGYLVFDQDLRNNIELCWTILL